jgi:hypothetical protein
MSFSMDNAPRDREIVLTARRLVVGLGPFEEATFEVIGKFYHEHGFWAAEDKPPHGLPSLGLVPLAPVSWRH